MKYKVTIVIILLFALITNTTHFKAESDQKAERMYLYKLYSKFTDVPWYLLGAIDQYERNIRNFRDYCPKEDELISICIDPNIWTGVNNPIIDDNDPHTISMFLGIGSDGDNDGYADRLNPIDRLYTMLSILIANGTSDEDIKDTLLNYYGSEKGVNIIFEIAKLFETYQTIELTERVFPIPKYYSADYTNGFGTGRSYGGYRIHEGVDIFSHYGTPVVSTAYGVVEIMGWNRFGGYRIGIRDMYNTYQYYAHLNYYVKGLKEGDIVEPGQVIGYVGSTGYGKEGTSGRFPPHLHFGFYKFDGKREWAFNPYNYLRKWNRISYRR
ncbi:M23 family metallopeptidase [Mycoplasmatota bacterium WC44]